MDIKELTRPFVQAIMPTEKRSNLRYEEAVLPGPRTLGEYLMRDWYFVISLLPWIGFNDIWFPWMINVLGDILGTKDENGNNYNNFYIIWLEQFGAYGLFEMYNLFNMKGWQKMFTDCILFWCTLIIFEPFVIWYKVWNQDITVNDF